MSAIYNGQVTDLRPTVKTDFARRRFEMDPTFLKHTFVKSGYSEKRKLLFIQQSVEHMFNRLLDKL
jgi:hypothetical protein